VLADLGIGILPLWAIHRELTAGELKPLLQRYSPAAKDIYAIYPTRSIAPRLRTFIDFIEADLRQPTYRVSVCPNRRGE
jgi:DNA-binding transcriptional LysR family regulator